MRDDVNLNLTSFGGGGGGGGTWQDYGNHSVVSVWWNSLLDVIGNFGREAKGREIESVKIRDSKVMKKKAVGWDTNWCDKVKP